VGFFRYGWVHYLRQLLPAAPPQGGHPVQGAGPSGGHQHPAVGAQPRAPHRRALSAEGSRPDHRQFRGGDLPALRPVRFFIREAELPQAPVRQG